MREDLICDTVCDLCSSGKRLPPPVNGVDPYDAMCKSFIRAFKDDNYSEEDWLQAKENYLKNPEDQYVVVGVMQRYIAETVAGKSRQPVIAKYTTEQMAHMDSWRRSNCKLAQCTKRMMSQKGLMSTFVECLPGEDEVRKIGLKHGLTDGQINKGIDLGGQGLLIQAFVAEYRACKKYNLPFPYRMQVVNGEIEWEVVK